MPRLIAWAKSAKASAALILALLASPAIGDGSDKWLPTHSLTPGATNPKIGQANIKQNICKKGWSTKSIRPPSDYTETLKKKQLQQPRYTDKKPADYEEDHLISLEIGGHPRDPKNLWPQPYAGKCGARVKDKLEDKLHELVCAGTVTLAAAQHEIATDWVTAYNRYVGKLSCD